MRLKPGAIILQVAGLQISKLFKASLLTAGGLFASYQISLVPKVFTHHTCSYATEVRQTSIDFLAIMYPASYNNDTEHLALLSAFLPFRGGLEPEVQRVLIKIGLGHPSPLHDISCIFIIDSKILEPGTSLAARVKTLIFRSTGHINQNKRLM